MNTLTEFDISKTAKIVEDFLVHEGQKIVEGWNSLSIAKTKDAGKDVVTNFDISVEK